MPTNIVVSKNLAHFAGNVFTYDIRRRYRWNVQTTVRSMGVHVSPHVRAELPTELSRILAYLPDEGRTESFQQIQAGCLVTLL